MTTDRKTILFLCTGNSCRSQMAEGWTRYLCGETINPYSAGTEPHGVNPLAIRAMAEVGVDLYHHTSKHRDELSHLTFDLVITVCDNAASSCPLPPTGARLLHVPFDDPPQLARNAHSEEEALVHYRRVRDEIKAFVENLPAVLQHTIPSVSEVTGHPANEHGQ